MLHRRLAELEKKGKPIRVGLIGAGRMGLGVLHQITRTKGMRIAAVADCQASRAAEAAQSNLSSRGAVLATDNLAEATRVVESGGAVATSDSRMVCRLPLDVVIEATGIPDSGAQVALEAIEQKKHIVTLNVEADAVIGPILSHLANRAGVVYTVTAGDEPGVLGGMYEWAVSIGLQVVVAGKGCMRPIDWNANPDSVAAEAKRLGINPKMLASFRDGSKHNVEVCVVANGTGLVPDVRGTHARPLALDEIPRVLCPKKDGGILDQSGVVEIAPPVLDAEGRPDMARSVTPGVYLVVTTDHPQIHADFKYLLVGDGPYYLLHRPFHLCAMETPNSIARAAIYGDATLNAPGGPVAEVIAIAKRDLKPGEILTGSGGAEITGQIEKHAICRKENLLPLGLAYGVKLKRAVPKGTPLVLDDVALDESLAIQKLWRLQQKTFPI